ncbi:hypothetical protein A3Q56_06276, partial [Intoshia linei]
NNRFSTTVMIWGCISMEKGSRVKIVSGRLNSIGYRNILNESLKPFLKVGEFTNPKFQQDNAPCHKARLIIDWMQENGIQLMNWPPNTPDVNIIEHVWPRLKAKINEICQKVNTVAELSDIITREWSIIIGDPKLKYMPDKYPPSRGFCMKDCIIGIGDDVNTLKKCCLGEGVINMMGCKNSEIVMTGVNFLGAESFADGVKGLEKANKLNHGTWLEIEPVSGKVICARKMLQTNIMIRDTYIMEYVLLKRHKVCRLDFAKKYHIWREDRRNVIFIDEKKFNLDGPDLLQYYWHDIKKDDSLFLFREHGGGSIMGWGAFGYNGKLNLKVINGRLNSSEYIKMLNKSNLKHIENIWGILARQVYKNGKQYDSIQELKIGIISVWNEMFFKDGNTNLSMLSNYLFPLFYVNESACIDHELANLMISQLHRPLKMANSTPLILLIAGIILLVIFLAVFAISQKRK